MIDSFIEEQGGLPERTDALWSQLNLGELLGDKTASLPQQLSFANMTKEQREAADKFDKKWKKANHNVMINRYEAQPHKPTVLTRDSLERLADPIRQRYRGGSGNDGGGSDREHSASPSRAAARSGIASPELQLQQLYKQQKIPFHRSTASNSKTAAVDHDHGGSSDVAMMSTDADIENVAPLANSNTHHTNTRSSSSSGSDSTGSGNISNKFAAAAKVGGPIADANQLAALASAMEAQAKMLRLAAEASRSHQHHPQAQAQHLDRNISNIHENIERMSRMKQAIAEERNAAESAAATSTSGMLRQRTQPRANAAAALLSRTQSKQPRFGRGGVLGQHKASATQQLPNRSAVTERATNAMRNTRKQQQSLGPGKSRAVLNQAEKQRKQRLQGGKAAGFNRGAARGSSMSRSSTKNANTRTRGSSTTRQTGGTGISSGRGRSGRGGGTFLTGGMDSEDDESRCGRSRSRSRSVGRGRSASSDRAGAGSNKGRNGMRGRSTERNAAQRSNSRTNNSKTASRDRSQSVERRRGSGGGRGANGSVERGRKITTSSASTSSRGASGSRGASLTRQKSQAQLPVIMEATEQQQKLQQQRQRHLQNKRHYVMERVADATGGTLVGGAADVSDEDSRSELPRVGLTQRATAKGAAGVKKIAAVPALQRESKSTPGLLPGMSRGGAKIASTGAGTGAKAPSNLAAVDENGSAKAKSAGYMAPGGAKRGRDRTPVPTGRSNNSSNTTGNSGVVAAGKPPVNPRPNPLRLDAMAGKKQDLIAFLSSVSGGTGDGAGTSRASDVDEVAAAAAHGQVARSTEEVNQSLEKTLEQSLSWAGSTSSAAPLDAIARNKKAVSSAATTGGAAKRLTPVNGNTGAGATTFAGGGANAGAPTTAAAVDDDAMAALLASHAKRISEKLQKVSMHTAEYNKLKGPQGKAMPDPAAQGPALAPPLNAATEVNGCRKNASPTAPVASAVSVSSPPSEATESLRKSSPKSPTSFAMERETAIATEFQHLRRQSPPGAVLPPLSARSSSSSRSSSRPSSGGVHEQDAAARVPVPAPGVEPAFENEVADAEKSFFTAMINRNLHSSLSSSVNAVQKSVTGAGGNVDKDILRRSSSSSPPLSSSSSGRCVAVNASESTNQPETEVEEAKGKVRGGGLMSDLDVDAALAAFVQEQQARMFAESPEEASGRSSRPASGSDSNREPQVKQLTERSTATPLLAQAEEHASVEDLQQLYHSFESGEEEEED